MGTHPIFESDFDCLTVKMGGDGTTTSTSGGARSGVRRSLSRTQSAVNRNKTFIKYAKLGDDKNLLSMLRSTRAQPDWEHEGESALVAASSKAQIKCVNELIKAGADCNQRDSNGSIPICAVSDVPIIGYGTRLNEYRSGQDVDKMARTVTVLDMLINQGSLLISRDHENRTPLDLSRTHNNWPAYLILRLNENHVFNDELKSIVTYFLDVFEKMKVTDLNSIKLHMIHLSATNNIEGMVNLLDMFDDTEETWFPFWYKFALYVCEARLKHRQLSTAKRGELVELVELLKDFKSNFKNGFLSSEESEDSDMTDPNRDTVISESDAVAKIAQLQIRSNHLESLHRRTDRQIESRLQEQSRYSAKNIGEEKPSSSVRRPTIASMRRSYTSSPPSTTTPVTNRTITPHSSTGASTSGSSSSRIELNYSASLSATRRSLYKS